MKDFLDVAESLGRSGQGGDAADAFQLVLDGIAALQHAHSKAAINLDNVEFHLVEHIQHIVLKVGIGLINLVNQAVGHIKSNIIVKRVRDSHDVRAIFKLAIPFGQYIKDFLDMF